LVWLYETLQFFSFWQHPCRLHADLAVYCHTIRSTKLSMVQEAKMANLEKMKQSILGDMRFGLGQRAGQDHVIDIRSALLEEIDRAMPLLADDTLSASPEAFQAIRDFQEKERTKRVNRASKNPTADGMAMAEGGAGEAMAAEGMMPSAPQIDKAPDRRAKGDRPAPQVLFQAEAKARIAMALTASPGFAERLVWFWSNHFCVSLKKSPIVRGLAGSFEREAIRPHVFGRFSDMLLAVTRHPAMLAYLDNRQSFGPNSPAGQRGKRGLNENHAREILELHTLGVDGGYKQSDVRALAEILTGWTFQDRDPDTDGTSLFRFAGNRHERGPKTMRGKTYAQPGEQQGIAALSDLASAKATADHIAQKLARHFVADAPPESLVKRLSKTFLASKGDLAAVSRELISSDESWAPARKKLRSPVEFLTASFRALEVKPEPRMVLNMLDALGQPLWQPSGPNGFPDNEAAWASAEGFSTRLDVADRLSRLATTRLSPSDLADEIIGPLASEDTRRAIARAESPAQGFALLLMSPEFQRR
jgi:uncharacterized protein (DUF1800 family)